MKMSMRRHSVMQIRAAVAQLGYRQTGDLQALGSIPGLGKFPRALVAGCALYDRMEITLRSAASDYWHG